jgi:hypothetical protein
MKAPGWVWLLGIGAAGFGLYWLFKKLPKPPTPSQIAQDIASIWLKLPWVGLPPDMVVLGNVKLPDGTLYPLKQLQSGQIREDKSQTPPAVLANVNGSIYQLSPSDSEGNYPGALVGAAPAGS